MAEDMASHREKIARLVSVYKTSVEQNNEQKPIRLAINTAVSEAYEKGLWVYAHAYNERHYYDTLYPAIKPPKPTETKSAAEYENKFYWTGLGGAVLGDQVYLNFARIDFPIKMPQCPTSLLVPIHYQLSVGIEKHHAS